jgi:uncharacterized protein YjbJ (UPF0337 family)
MNFVKWNAKKVGLDNLNNVSDSISKKGKEMVDSGAAWVKEKTPDSIDGFVDQAAAKGKELVENVADKVENMAEEKIQAAKTDTPSAA